MHLAALQAADRLRDMGYEVPVAPPLEELAERYALKEDYCECIEFEPDFEELAGYHPCFTAHTPNLQHLRGSLTRWLKGWAAHFG